MHPPRNENCTMLVAQSSAPPIVHGSHVAQQMFVEQHLFSFNGKTSVFLLDDVGAELDAVKREIFIDGLLASNAQLFVTAIERQQLGFIDKYNDKKMFHVEHGRVREEN